jgi:hypothetical protein
MHMSLLTEGAALERIPAGVVDGDPEPEAWAL